jgi:hypothetical protein
MTISSPPSEPAAQSIISGSLKRKRDDHSPGSKPERISKRPNAIETFHYQWEGRGRFLPNLEVFRYAVHEPYLGSKH